MWTVILHLSCASDAVSEVKKYNKMVAKKIDDKSATSFNFQERNIVKQVKVLIPIMGMKF